jgi:DNA replication protein DnaC
MSQAAHESLSLLLKSFRLPTMAGMVEDVLREAEQHNWGYRRFLQHLCEAEYHDRQSRKISRLLRGSCLPEGRSIDCLKESLVPGPILRQLPSLLDGSFVGRAENILAIGLPGRGKTFFLQVLAHELIVQCEYRVLSTSTFRLVQELLAAKADYQLDKKLKSLARFDVVLLDDLGYVQQSREEMEVLFTFLAERYERGSVMLSSNLVFSEWDQIFKDPMTTMAAIDRLIHHSILLEFTGPSIRELEAAARAKERGQ